MKQAVYFFLIALSLAIITLTKISTDISYLHMLAMGLALIFAVLAPFIYSKYIVKDASIRFPLHHGRNWHKAEVLYVLFTGVVAYLFLPFYLQNTGAYHNWSVQLDASHLIRLFVGTNALGIWDELFFICIVLAILRKYLPFTLANLLQAILFTTFLFELGFQGWAPPVIYIFALSQGYIFRRTESILYIVTIHLTIDLILFLALIHAYYPRAMPIFIT